MDLNIAAQLMKTLNATDVTTTTHKAPYPYISPSKPSHSQAGRTILITGGGTGVGFAVARSFVRASAARVVIVGRRGNVLDEARVKLEEEARQNVTGTATKILTRVCDALKDEQVAALWTGLADDGIVVDVLLSNAARFAESAPLRQLGVQEVWAGVDANGRAAMVMVEHFLAQGVGKAKVSIATQTSVGWNSAD